MAQHKGKERVWTVSESELRQFLLSAFRAGSESQHAQFVTYTKGDLIRVPERPEESAINRVIDVLKEREE